MKKNVPANRKVKESFATPDWMPPEVAKKAKTLDPCARIEMAEKLEAAAAQLREFKPPPVRYVATATVHLRPAMKDAILFYGRKCAGEQKFDEQEMLSVGVRWVLEEALCLIEIVHEFSANRVAYRDAEQLEDSVQTEDMIRASLEKFKAKFNHEGAEL